MLNKVGLIILIALSLGANAQLKEKQLLFSSIDFCFGNSIGANFGLNFASQKRFTFKFDVSVLVRNPPPYPPIQKAYGNFGSIIFNEKTVLFNNCSGPKSKIDSETDILFDIYPNPSSDFINIAANVPENSIGKISIFTIDGRFLSEMLVPSGYQVLNIETSDYRTGIYIVSLNIDGVNIENKRLIKR